MSPMIMFPASVAGLGVMAPAIGGGITAPGPWSLGAPAAWAGDLVLGLAPLLGLLLSGCLTLAKTELLYPKNAGT